MVQYRIEQYVGNNLSELAYAATDKLDRSLFERYREVQIIAGLEPFRNPQRPDSERKALLETLQSTYPHYSWIGFTDAQGVVQLSTEDLLHGESVAERPWFIQGQRAPMVGDVHEAKLLATLLPPDPTGEPLRFVDVAAPVIDARNLRGVLGAHLSWQWAEEEVEASLLRTAPDHKELFIIAQDGKVLLGPKSWIGQTLEMSGSKFVKPGQSGYRIEQWADGETYLVGMMRSAGYRDYPGLGWTILIRQKAEDAFVPALELHRQILIGGALLGIFFALLSWLLAERITQPMLQLATAADQIRQGNTAITLPILSGQDEIARFSQTFHHLVTALVAREHELSVANERLEAQLLMQNHMAESLRRSEEQFRQIAENIRDVFWVYSLSRQKWMYVSPAYEEIWGQPCESLYAHPDAWLQCVHPDDQPRISAVTEQRLQGTFDQQYRIVRGDGDLRWVRDRAFPVYNPEGQLYRIVGLVQDITKHKQAEEARQQLQQEREVSELKSHFISIASHEFRTPLTVIKTSASLLENFDKQLTESKRQQYFDRIKAAIKHLTQILDEILLIGKAEAGRLEFHPESVNLIQFCSDLMEEMKLSTSTQHQFVFRHRGIYTDACVDTNLLRTALTNLLSNAIKYSPAEGEIQLNLICSQVDVAMFQVRDSGIGIPESEQAKLFESFYRCSNTGKIPGTGLGLSIVKEVVEFHGGQVTLSSQAGQGSTFTVSVPSSSCYQNVST
nr:ATP-binding protein [Oculatella sp. LEGE 06141]